jgi:hypothetical protein
VRLRPITERNNHAVPAMVAVHKAVKQVMVPVHDITPIYRNVFQKRYIETISISKSKKTSPYVDGAARAIHMID